jgi:hypothetical protein
LPELLSPIGEPANDAEARRPTPLMLIEPGRPARAEAEAFIEARFGEAFGARPTSAYPIIAAQYDPDGRIAAAAGVRFAEDAPLFLERYLDEAVEQAVATAFGGPVARAGVAEIGSLAAVDVAAALALFDALAAWLAGPCRRRYAVATARPELERLLRRSGFDLRAVADAAPDRLGASAADWGTYYAAGPRVLAGRIGALPAAGLPSRLQARLARQAARRPVERRA